MPRPDRRAPTTERVEDGGVWRRAVVSGVMLICGPTKRIGLQGDSSKPRLRIFTARVHADSQLNSALVVVSSEFVVGSRMHWSSCSSAPSCKRSSLICCSDGKDAKARRRRRRSWSVSTRKFWSSRRLRSMETGKRSSVAMLLKACGQPLNCLVSVRSLWLRGFG